MKMKTSDIEELLLKSGNRAYQAGPLNEETEENTQYGRLPKAYVTDGIFVKPAKEDMKVKVNYTDIVWIEAENNNCHIHLSAGAFLTVRHNIMTLMEMLPKRWFVKVNRSEIVNISRVYKICGNMLSVDGSSRSFSVSKSNRGYVFSCFKELSR